MAKETSHKFNLKLTRSGWKRLKAVSFFFGHKIKEPVKVKIHSQT